jgi:hypothetical protein
MVPNEDLVPPAFFGRRISKRRPSSVPELQLQFEYAVVLE